MKTIILIFLVVTTGISFGQTITFETKEKCKIIAIKNLPDPGTFDTIIERGLVYLQVQDGKLFTSICYKISGTIYGYVRNHTLLEDGVLTLEVPAGKNRRPMGSTLPIVIALQFSKKDLATLQTFLDKIPKWNNLKIMAGKPAIFDIDFFFLMFIWLCTFYISMYRYVTW